MPRCVGVAWDATCENATAGAWPIVSDPADQGAFQFPATKSALVFESTRIDARISLASAPVL